MLRPRIIPCLLLHQGGLYKTQEFKSPIYLGDPVNAVKIFNEKEADELLVLDIDATAEGRGPNFHLLSKLAAECRMPLCYGGGVASAKEAIRLVDLGVEKVAVSAAAIANPDILTEMADAVGRQSVVAVLDVRKKTGLFAKGMEARTSNGKVMHSHDPIALAVLLQESGAGEIVINSIDRDGLMQGYDLDTAVKFRNALKVPITILGGAGSLDDIRQLLMRVGVVGAAAGSLFVFKGKYRAVLINYPSPIQKKQLFSEAFAVPIN
jgi:cyclase